MKAKLTLLLTAFALSGAAYAGPSDSAAFAVRHAREAAQADNTKSVAVTAGNGGMVTYVPASSGKGALVTRNDDGSTNVALFKSKKSSTECSQCSKAAAQKRQAPATIREPTPAPGPMPACVSRAGIRIMSGAAKGGR
jgi:hypothetical protein